MAHWSMRVLWCRIRSLREPLPDDSKCAQSLLPVQTALCGSRPKDDPRRFIASITLPWSRSAPNHTDTADTPNRAVVARVADTLSLHWRSVPDLLMFIHPLQVYRGPGLGHRRALPPRRGDQVPPPSLPCCIPRLSQ